MSKKKVDLRKYGLSGHATPATEQDIIQYIVNRLPDGEGQHYSTLWIRRNGKDERYEFDWLGKAQAALKDVRGPSA